jgi:hypothetical protein
LGSVLPVSIDNIELRAAIVEGLLQDIKAPSIDEVNLQLLVGEI